MVLWFKPYSKNKKNKPVRQPKQAQPQIKIKNRDDKLTGKFFFLKKKGGLLLETGYYYIGNLKAEGLLFNYHKILFKTIL